MSLGLVAVATVGSRDKNNPFGRKNELTPVATLALVNTAASTLTSNPGQWYSLGGVRQNAPALQAIIVQNELAISPGFRIECQISEETNTAARTRRTQTVYVRAVAV